MGTDLFKQYYSNPKKQYVYSDIVCSDDNGADLVFNIKDSDGIISNSDGTEAKIDLSDLNIDITSYDSQSMVLKPNSITGVRGTSLGEQQMTRGFGYFDASIISEESWKYFVKVQFNLKFRKGGRICIYDITAEGSSTELIDIEVAIQNIFDSKNIPINVYLIDNYLMFIGQDAGFEFFVDDCKYCVINVDEDTNSPFNAYMLNTDDPADPFCEVLNELEEVYVPSMKYKNGAFKGILFRVIYPSFNDSSITPAQRSIKMAYVQDRVYKYDELLTGTNNVFYRSVVDVDIEYKNTNEYKALKWRFADSIDCSACRFDEDDLNPWISPNARYKRNPNDSEWLSPADPHIIPVDDEWYEEINNTRALPRQITIHVSPLEKTKKLIGLYGYADYVEKNKMWIPVGAAYMNTATIDDTNTRNLVPSFILYNPNSYPIQIKLMTFI